MKKVWGFIIIIAIIGMGMMATGYVFGASRSLYIDNRGVHISNNDTKMKTIKEDVKKFTDIEIDVLTPIVELIPSNKFRIEIEYNENSPITYSVNNGCLKINQKMSSNKINFNLSFDEQGYIKIYFPDDTIFEDIEIKISSGEVIINDLTSSSVDLKLTSGKITANGIISEEISLVCTSGDVKFEECEAESFDFKMSSGSLNASDIKSLDNFNLKMTSGNASIKGKLLGENTVKLTSGNAKIAIDGQERDYDRSVKITSGSVYINGKSNTSNYNGNDASNDLNIDITSGNVSISFNE